MAIKNKFIHFKTKAGFLNKLQEYVTYNENTNTYTIKSGKTDDWNMFKNYTCFIKETHEIWTHEQFYKCDVNASEVKTLVNERKVNPATIAPFIAGIAAVGTSTKYAREDHVHPAQTTVSGNAGTATKLETARTINGTNFDGSNNITTSNWGESRKLTLTGAVTGNVSINGSSDVSLNTTLTSLTANQIPDIDASKITTGTIDIARLPAGALERLFVCDTEALALSTDVQEGDVVQVVSNNNKMYFCINSTATTFASKFKEFTAGTATSVSWSGVTNKPTTFTPAVHNQASNTITSLKGYTKGSASALTVSDTLNAALGKLEANIDTSVKFNASQSLTDLQKEQALSNIGLDTIILSFTEIGITKENYYAAIITKELFDKIYNATHIIVTDFPLVPDTNPEVVSDTHINVILNKSYSGKITQTPYALFSTIIYDGNADIGNPFKTGILVNGPQPDSGEYVIQYYGGKSTFIDYENIQDLTSTEKRTACSNIGAATQDWVTSKGYLTSIPMASASTLGGIKLGFTNSPGEKRYPIDLTLDGNAYVSVPWTDTTYTIATASVPGLVKPMKVTTKPTLNSITTNSNRYYAIEMSNDGNMFVNVPWTTSSYSLPMASTSTLGGVKIGSNITVSSGTISLSKDNVTSALGYTPANINDIPEVPITLPNPYKLTINGISYDGSSNVSITTTKKLTVTALSSSTVNAGYSYNNTTARTISTLKYFSSDNPDTVIISTAKLTFTASNTIKMDGLENLSGTYYIYCLSYMANGEIAINGAVYA